MIIIVDYGMGNLGSIENMFKKLKVDAKISSKIAEIEMADKIVLPGVGAFDKSLQNIHKLDLLDILNYKVLSERVPILGICLGMQLMTNSSEEGNLPGFGWISAKTYKFKFEGTESYKIPHMGWNDVSISNVSRLTNELPVEPRFYFVHSFYVSVQNRENSILKTTYGLEFDSAIQRDNIYGVQFHPEKSHKYGMKLLENFSKINVKD